MDSRASVTDPIRVVMVDLLSVVPYYTGHLCGSLKHCDGVAVTLASITYQHDRSCYRRHGIHNDPGLMDLTHRLSFLPGTVRRLCKLSEYAVNMTALLVKFGISRPDVVHVQFFPLTSHGLAMEAWWLRVIRTLGIQVVYTVHNVLPQDGRGNLAGYRKLYRLADRLVCHDAAAVNRLIAEFGMAAERIVTIPHGPLFEKSKGPQSAPARARLGFAPDECIVLWQGIVRPYKGVSFLLKAWKTVCEQDSHARLAIVGTGDPDLLRSLEEEVETLGLASRVRLDLRFVAVGELTDFYEAADVLVYPYSDITTSGALLTGIVRGKAIVASRLPAFEQVLRDEETALLVPYGDAQGLADALLRLIKDEDLRDSLSKQLSERQAAIPRWKEIAERTCDCYRAAVSQQRHYIGQPASA